MPKQIPNIIIGGGITGLSIAYKLQQAKERFTLFEAQEFGGVLKTEHTMEFILEQGPNVFLLRPALKKLLAELNLEDEIVYPQVPKFKQLVFDPQCGELVAVPRSPQQFLLHPSLSFSEKIRITLGLFKKNVIPADAQDLTVAELFLKLGSSRLVDVFVDGGLKGIYGGSVYNLSARSLMPNLWQHLKTGNSLFSYTKKISPAKMIMLKGGNDALYRRLLESLPTENLIKNRISKIVIDSPNNFFVTTEDQQEYHCQKIYFATALSNSHEYLSSGFSEVIMALSQVPYTSLALAHVAIASDQVLPSASFGFLVPGQNVDGFLGVMFNSNLFPHVSKSDRQLITVCIGGVERSDLMNQSQEFYQELISLNLKRYLNINSFELLNVVSWERAIPQLHKDHFQINLALEAFEKRFPGVHFLGNDLGGIGVSERINRVVTKEF